MADFSDYPAKLFAMFRQGSISDLSGVDMAPCRSVAILLNREAGIFFRKIPPSDLRVESVYNYSNKKKEELNLKAMRSFSENNPSE